MFLSADLSLGNGFNALIFCARLHNDHKFEFFCIWQILLFFFIFQNLNFNDTTAELVSSFLLLNFFLPRLESPLDGVV